MSSQPRATGQSRSGACQPAWATHTDTMATRYGTTHRDHADLFMLCHRPVTRYSATEKLLATSAQVRPMYVLPYNHRWVTRRIASSASGRVNRPA